MMRSDSKRNVEKSERRKGVFIENYHPFIPPPESSELSENKLALQSNQLSIHKLTDRHFSKEEEEEEGDSLSQRQLHSTNDDLQNQSIDEMKPKKSAVINKTHRVIQELLHNEQKYITSLKNGIKDYIVPFDTFPLPQTLSGQRLNIFSNIEAILEFHEKKFWPKLVECGHDPAEIADVFITLIQANNFDNYISYVVNRKKSSKLCEENKYFFMQLEKDQLGVDSFLLQPIQRLPRYQLMLDEVVKLLINDLQTNKTAIAKCCKAEKNIQKLLNIVNDHCEV